jgi:hexokinase
MESLQDPLDALTWFINEKDLHVLARKFSACYRNLAKTSLEHFLATPVTELPTGLEKGKFVAIDVGGSNLRVGLIELCGDSLPKLKRTNEKAWPIEDHLKQDQADDLFLWIGDCIAEVIEEAIEDGVELGNEVALGITFSFPMTYVQPVSSISLQNFPKAG